MKIEPCPFCGTKLIRRDSGWVKMFACGKMECPYRVDFADIEKHNRLSRIVRAAEALVAARKALVEAFAQMGMDYPHFSVSNKANELTRDIDNANRALTQAVEGGAE